MKVGACFIETNFVFSWNRLLAGRVCTLFHRTLPSRRPYPYLREHALPIRVRKHSRGYDRQKDCYPGLAASDDDGSSHPVGVEYTVIRVLSGNSELHEESVSLIYLA